MAKMLPDIPSIKAEISKRFQLYFKHRLNEYLGVINEAPRCYIKEGRRAVSISPDGQEIETVLKEASAETIVNYSEVPSLSFATRFAKLDEAAREMANQISEHAFSQINEAVDRVGNVVDAKGKPFDPEAFFMLLEKIQLDFDEEGNHRQISVVTPPKMAERATEVLKQIQGDPKYQRRYTELIERKRLEWRDREAARRLVG